MYLRHDHAIDDMTGSMPLPARDLYLSHLLELAVLPVSFGRYSSFAMATPPVPPLLLLDGGLVNETTPWTLADC